MRRGKDCGEVELEWMRLELESGFEVELGFWLGGFKVRESL